MAAHTLNQYKGEAKVQRFVKEIDLKWKKKALPRYGVLVNTLSMLEYKIFSEKK